jgi:DNA topoisomerase-1
MVVKIKNNIIGLEYNLQTSIKLIPYFVYDFTIYATKMPPKFKIKHRPRPPYENAAAYARPPASVATARPGSARTLVIVESPAKCQKIEGYLGKDKYQCLASFGHIREIADGLKSIDVDHEFAIKFAIMSSKQAQVAKLRAAIADATEVILATDDDREGEAIAWHLCQVFHLSVLTTKRIIFHEITEPALKAAVAAPRTIDMSLVLAQQARQVLDLVVGYKISPVLWTYIAHTNLSAGRCQTPALRLVYENYKGIEASTATMVYSVSGIFTKLNLTFHLSREIESTGDSSQECLERFIQETAAAPDAGFRATVATPAKKTTKAPPHPYSTSTLQQAASNDLHLSPKDTMSVAQKLYEQGYITYMRTDSKVYSSEFVAKACDYIRKRFAGAGEGAGDELIGNLSTVSGSSSSKDTAAAAAAHEAIRPTDISRTLLPQSCHPREHRLYSMIHRNTLESLMAPAIAQSLTMAISSPVAVAGEPCSYRYTAEQIIKPGWKLVAGGYDAEAKEYTYFASLASPGSAAATATTVLSAPFKRIMTKCSLRNSKSHYTESGLVQLLEKMGIGRPSTFSSLIDKIQERGYVKLQDIRGKSLECREFTITEPTQGGPKKIESKTEVREIGGESRKLVIQPLGIIVIEFLLTHFAPLFEYDFTKDMENQLDEIATGGMVWHELCYKCWFDVTAQLQELKDRGVVKEEIHIDDRHSYIMGKNGPVIRCRVGADAESDKDEDVDDASEASDDDDSGVSETIRPPNAAEKKPRFIFKSVRPDLEYAKIQRGEYSLAYMLGEAHVNEGSGGTGTVTATTSAPAPVSVAGGGRLMGQHQGQDVIIKSGKYGAYIAWGSMNLSLKPLLGGGGGGTMAAGKKFIYKGKAAATAAATVNQKTEFDLTLQDVVAFIERNSAPVVVDDGGTGAAAAPEGTHYQGQILRTIDENTTIRYGRYGPYIFHKTAKMSKPAFVALKGFPEKYGNYMTCEAAVIREWVEAGEGTGGGAPAKPKPKFGFFKKK